MFDIITHFRRMLGMEVAFSGFPSNSNLYANQTLFEDRKQSFATNTSIDCESSTAKDVIREVVKVVNETIAELKNEERSAFSYYLKISALFLSEHWLLIGSVMGSTFIMILLTKKLYDFSNNFMNFDIPLDHLHENIETNRSLLLKAIEEYSENSSKKSVPFDPNIDEYKEEELPEDVSKGIFGGFNSNTIDRVAKEVNQFEDKPIDRTEDQNEPIIRKSGPFVDKVIEAMIKRKRSSSNLKKIFCLYYKSSDELQTKLIHKCDDNCKNLDTNREVFKRSDRRRTDSSNKGLTFSEYLCFVGFLAMTAFIVYRNHFK